jgi:hypothetical protein|tara:strand:+ start:533 stop:805 length:273 start_codon:yes stop_codon:yes gene_type:complete
MSRYKNTEKRKTEDGKLVYRSTLFDNVPVSDNDIYIITQYGDRLDLLAHQFYGDVSLWWYIARANNVFTFNVPENIQLRIPGSTQYAQGT